MLLEAIVRTRFELLESPASFSDTNDRNIEVTALEHRLQGREYLLVSQVSGCTKKHQRVGIGIGHSHLLKPLLSYLQTFPGARRIHNALRTATCLRSQPRPAS